MVQTAFQALAGTQKVLHKNHDGTVKDGGLGGGGNGSKTPEKGTPNTGGGGGGLTYSQLRVNSGGSGIVMIKYIKN